MRPLLPFFLAAASAMRIHGSSACPSPEDVGKSLETLGVVVPSNQSVELENSPQGLRVRLVDQEGSRLAEKSFPKGASCAWLADATAQVLATWENRPPSLNLVAPELVADPEPTGTAQMETATVINPVEPTSSSLPWELGLGAALYYANAVQPPGILAFASLGGRPAFFRLSVDLELDTTVITNSGSQTWNRPALGLGGGYRFEPSFGSFELAAELLMGVLVVNGDGPPPVRLRGFDAGLRLSGYLFIGHSALRPWVGLSAQGWLRSSGLFFPAEGSGGQRLSLAGGAAYAFP
jgi:hypothetical protein